MSWFCRDNNSNNNNNNNNNHDDDDNNNNNTRLHDGDSEHSPMKEKNRSSYVILPIFMFSHSRFSFRNLKDANSYTIS